MAVLLAVGFTVGWHAHLWHCQRRRGCPVWREREARKWTDALARRHPTGETNPWAHWKPAPPVDEDKESGAPLERMETPVTGIANPKRKTTP
jgi:hypothetical protein